MEKEERKKNYDIIEHLWNKNSNTKWTDKENNGHKKLIMTLCKEIV